MSCVLRISAPRLDDCLSQVSIKPYRVERGTAHFDVSASDFDDFTGQINDAIAFLRSQAAEIRLMMNEPSADGVLDFAIEWRDVAAQFDTFPAELVREASNLGLALEVSHYPAAEQHSDEA